MERRSEYYHAHIYFTAASRPQAEALQLKLRNEFRGTARVSRLIDEPIGPHPLGMFEVDFLFDVLVPMRKFLEAHRGSLDILIHQNTDDEIWNHTEGAEWLGHHLELDLDALRRFMAGQVGSVRRGLHE